MLRKVEKSKCHVGGCIYKNQTKLVSLVIHYINAVPFIGTMNMRIAMHTNAHVYFMLHDCS